MPSLQDVVKNELRFVLENALTITGQSGNDLITDIDASHRVIYTQGRPRRARGIRTEWAWVLANADAALQTHWFPAGKPLEHTGVFIAAHPAIVATGRTPASLQIAWTELLNELVTQQKQDLITLFKLVYERKFSFWDRDVLARDYHTICQAISRHFEDNRTRGKKVIQNGDLFLALNKYMEQVWSGVRGKDAAHVIKYINLIRDLFVIDYFEYSGEGLGLIWASPIMAFQELGFTVDLSGVITGVGTAAAYLKHNVGKNVAPPIRARALNAKRGNEYFYAWWLFDTEEDFEKVHQSMCWPRNRQQDRVNYREPGQKEENLAALLGASKGTGAVTGHFLGARDLCNREVPFTDDLRKPLLKPGMVIALGAAKAKLFDMATKEIRMGDWIHSVRQQPSMTIPQLIRQYVREGKMRFDATNLIWHWTKWDGALPVKYGRITGRVVDHALMNALMTGPPPAFNLPLPLATAARAQVVFASRLAGLGLDHGVTVELFDPVTGAAAGSKPFPTNPAGKFDISDYVPLGTPFRVWSAKTATHKKGEHHKGWPPSPHIPPLTAANPEFENIIVPKEVTGGGGTPFVTVLPAHEPRQTDTDRQGTLCSAPFSRKTEHVFGPNSSAELTFDVHYNKVDPATTKLCCFLLYCGAGPLPPVPIAPPNYALGYPFILNFQPADLKPVSFQKAKIDAYVFSNSAGYVHDLQSPMPVAGLPGRLLGHEFAGQKNRANQSISIKLETGANPYPISGGPWPTGRYRLYCVVHKANTGFTATDIQHIVTQNIAGACATLWDFNYITFTIVK